MARTVDAPPGNCSLLGAAWHPPSAGLGSRLFHSRSVMSLMSIPTCACLETLTFYPVHVSSLGLLGEQLLDQTLLPSLFFQPFSLDPGCSCAT